MGSNNNQNKYILNKSVYFKPLDKNKVLVYNPENQEVIYIDKSIKDLILSESYFNSRNFNIYPKLFEELVIKEILVNKLYSNNKINSIKDYIKKPHLNFLYIITTDKCNLRCKYCFIEGNCNYNIGNMSSTILKKGFDLFVNNLDVNKTAEILFYGGEPLLNKNIVFEGSKISNELVDSGKVIKIKKDIITNGTLITKLISNFLYSNEFGIGISIDGPKSIHNKMRIFENGVGCYDSTINGYNLLKKSGSNPGISCTISNHNINKLPEIIEFFAVDLEAKSIGLNISLDSLNFKSNDEINKLTKSLLGAQDIIQKYNLTDTSFKKVLDPFVNKYIRFLNCGACGKQLILTPNGKIGPCHAMMYDDTVFNKSIFDCENIYTNPIFLEWSQRSCYNILKCKSCFARSVCGGGCAYRAKLDTGTIFSPDKKYCKFAKESLNKILNDSYKLSKR